MRALADEVTKYGADAVISVGEVWTAPIASLKPYERPSDSPERLEALTACLVVKNGPAIQLSALIRRHEDHIELEATEVNQSPVLMAFAPVFKAWKQSIPDVWMEAGMRLAAGESE